MNVVMRCPLCKKEFEPTESDAPPFCSERCRTIDLGRWLGEQYSLPDIHDPDDDEAADEPGDPQSPAGHSSEPSL